MHFACALLTVNALSGMQQQGELSSVTVIGQSECRAGFTSEYYDMHINSIFAHSNGTEQLKLILGVRYWVLGRVSEMQLA